MFEPIDRLKLMENEEILMRLNLGFIIISFFLLVCAIIGYKSTTKKKYAEIELRYYE